MWIIYCEGECIGEYDTKERARLVVKRLRAEYPYCQYKIRCRGCVAKFKYGRF
jgi:hypothetical protein